MKRKEEHFNSQFSLFFPSPVARKTDPETSHMAAVDAKKNMSHGRILVLKCLSVRSMTDYELADVTGWQQNSIGKRRGECMAVGFVGKEIDDEGEIVKRPAPSGSKAIVWKITEQGRRFLSGVNF